MKVIATTLAVASAISAVLAQNPIIQSPAALVQCQPVLISFSGGTAPYCISVLPGGQSSAAALETFPTQSGSTYTWTVDLAAGQDVTFRISDSTGAVNYSSQVPIQSSSDSPCLNGGSSSAGSSSAGTSSSSSSSRSSSSTSSSSSSSSSTRSSSSPSSSPSSTGSSTTGMSTSGTTTQSPSSSPTGAASSNYGVNAAAAV